MPDDRNRYGSFDDEARRDGRDRGQDRDESYASARDYGAGRGDRDDRNFRGGGNGYGGGSVGGRDRETGSGRDDNRGGGERYRSYGHDGQRYTEHGGREEYSRTGSWGGDRDWQREQGRDSGSNGASGSRFGVGGGGSGMFGSERDDHRQPRSDQGPRGGSNHDDRGFLDRAGDEVRSWFGDEEAERRRQFDQRQDEAMGGSRGAPERDEHYHSWRREQIAQLDRDYDEYRREHGSKFRNEFGTWRNERQTQRDGLNRVNEQMEVIGSDGQHVGTVDKVRGDRIILTKNDVDAGGRHHSIPSRWIDRVEDKVMIRKTADDAKREWRDEERSGAFFGDEGAAGTRNATGGSGSEGGAKLDDASRANATDTARGMQLRQGRDQDDGTVDLNRSFSGTYKKD